MSWLSTAFDAVTTGGIGTLLGGVTSAVAKHFAAKQKLEELKAKWEYEFKMTTLQMEQDKMMAEQKLLQIDAQGGWDALTGAIDAERSLSSVKGSLWANNLRITVRPLLTYGLWTSAVILSLVTLGWQSPELTATIYTIHAGATVALGFWFGSRYIK